MAMHASARQALRLLFANQPRKKDLCFLRDPMVYWDFGFLMQKYPHAHAAQPSKASQRKSHVGLVKMTFVPHGTEQHNDAEVR